MSDVNEARQVRGGFRRQNVSRVIGERLTTNMRRLDYGSKANL